MIFLLPKAAYSLQHLLTILFVLTSLHLTAQTRRFNFNHGVTASVAYANDLYGDGGAGIRTEIGHLSRLSTGKRLRGRIGAGISIAVNISEDKYKNNINRFSRSMIRRDTAADLRAGSFSTRFMAISIPLEYSFVADGRVPWSIGLSYRPGIMLLKSSENRYTLYDWKWTNNERLNETPETIEKASVKSFTEATTLYLGIETSRHLLRGFVGRDRWSYVDDYIGGEGRWLFGFEVVHWFRK